MNQVAKQRIPSHVCEGVHRLTPLDWRGGWGEPLVIRPPAVVGRGSNADVHLADQWVSRVHCRLTEEGGSLVVTDLDSRHGVHVNDVRVKRAELRPGDLLQLGGSQFLVDLRGDDSGSDVSSDGRLFGGEGDASDGPHS